jgi:hypothetical protein
MDWTSVISSLVGSGMIGILLAAFLTFWTNRRLAELQHSLAVKQEELADQRELDRKRRQSSAAVVEILSEWIRTSYTGGPSDEDLWQLQATYWKNILWLNADLVKALAPLLTARESAPTSKELIIEARKALLNLDAPDLSPDDLVTWTSKGKREPRVSTSDIAATTDIGDGKLIQA